MISKKLGKIKKSSIIVLVLLFVSIANPVSQLRADEQKPKYGPDAVPLSVSSEYFKDHYPPLFWKIIPYYVHQVNKWSCGAVSAVMVLNAARAILNITPQLKADQPLFYEEDFIKFLNKDSLLSGLFGGFSTRGIALPELGKILKEAIKEYKIGNASVEVVHMSGEAELQVKEKNLHKILMTLEKSDRHLLIANFNQGIFTGDADVGHYSAVAAYDSKNHKILLLDTDRQWYEPYWVTEEVFIKGMKTLDRDKVSRGYVHIELPSNNP